MKLKKAKVVMLPTEDESGICKDKLTSLIELSSIVKGKGGDYCEYQHLYFTTDEEIKKGDWCYDQVHKGVVEITAKLVGNYCYKKIIASTDPKLHPWESIYDPRSKTGGIMHAGVAQPSQQFLKEYCEAGGIDEVMVEYEEYGEELGADPAYFSLPSHRLKINPDNTINIHPVKERVYSKEQLIQIVHRAVNDVAREKIRRNSNESAKWVDNWIEENL